MNDRTFDDLELNYAAWLPADPGAAILDIGCGTGRILDYLHRRGYRDLEGFDRDPESIAIAQARGVARLSIGEDWPLILDARPDAFDLIVLKDVLYYLPLDRVAAALAAVHRALKPDGRIILEAFNGVSFTGPFVAYKDEGIQWIPTEHTLQRFIERAGFASVSVRAQRPPSRGLRRQLFNLAGAGWRGILRGIYFAERGLAEENPRIFTTKIIATAARQRAAAPVVTSNQ